MQMVAIFIVLLTYVGFMCYSALVLALWAYGLTPGKWMLGIGVVKRDTVEAILAHGTARDRREVYLRDSLLSWLYLGAGRLERQAWHDKIAKALVNPDALTARGSRTENVLPRPGRFAPRSGRPFPRSAPS